MTRSFRDRWGLEDENYNARCDKFIARVLLVCGDSKVTSKDEVYKIAFRLGCSPNLLAYSRNNYNNDWVFNLDDFVRKYTPSDLALHIEILLDSELISEKAKDVIIDLLKSSDLGFRITFSKKNGYQTFPSNIEILDDQVEAILKTLEKNANTHYMNALKAYKEGRWVDSADDTRRALEEHMRNILKNKKGLNANLKVLATALKDESDETVVTSAVNRMLRILDDCYNEGTKHNSEINSAEAANYFIYQITVLITTIDALLNISKDKKENS